MTDTDTEQLTALPCPFCGAPGEYDSQRWVPPVGFSKPGYTGHAVYCSSLECSVECGIHDTKEEAYAAWNRRPAQRSHSRGIIISFCDSCGSQLHQVTGEICLNCNTPVVQRNQRLEGVFDLYDGNRMLVLIGDHPID